MDWSDHIEDNGPDEYVRLGDKKRRLTFEQLKTLEKSFEQENKLELQRKMQLAKALTLQPRQIAVWFQNRRVRWRTKQIEKDFAVLKQDYDALKRKYDILLEVNSQLKNQVHQMSRDADNDDRNNNIGGSEIEPQQTSVLEPINFPMELSLEAEICKQCTGPLQYTYSMTRREQDGGCYTIISEAARSVFNIDSPLTIPSPDAQEIQRKPATNISCPLPLEGSSVAGGLKAPSPGHESHCPPKVQGDRPWLNQDEETCCNLFDSLEDHGALMLWEYLHLTHQ